MNPATVDLAAAARNLVTEPAKQDPLGRSSQVLLAPQIAELYVLKNYMIEMLALQLVEPELRNDAGGFELVAKVHDAIQEQRQSLATNLALLPGIGNETRKSAAALADLFVGLVTKVRARELHGILRAVLVTLGLAERKHAALREAARAANEQPLVDLCAANLGRLSPLVHGLKQLMP